jgi:hypothetical protein
VQRSTGALVLKQLFLALEKKNSEKKFSFLFIEQIVKSVDAEGQMDGKKSMSRVCHRAKYTPILTESYQV